jgi:hypothetical protein
LIGINGVHPLSGFRFIVVGSKLLPTIKSFHLIFEDLRQAIWGLEVCCLIAQNPPDLNQMLLKGNYHALSKLTGEFHFCANALEYYLELGRWLAYFHTSNKLFSPLLLMIATKNYDNMVFVSDKMPAETRLAAYDAMVAIEQGKVQFPKYLPLDSFKIIKRAFKQKKSLRELRYGLLGMFLCLRPLGASRLGMIRECLLNTTTCTINQ